MAKARTKTKPTSAGRCELCGRSFLKATMGRHLKACRKAHPAEPKKSAKPQAAYLVSIEGRYNSDYWLFVEMPTRATLDDLDRFLRDIWLECCGHMSDFHVRHTIYCAHPEGGFADFGWGAPDEQPMDTAIEDAFEVGDKADYTYDFGTSTRLTIKVAGEHESTFDSRQPVRLLARNDPPSYFRCDCGEPALVFDSLESDYYCLACFRRAEKGGHEIFPLALLNSPRAGECAYGADELDDFLKAARKRQAEAKKHATADKPTETA